MSNKYAAISFEFSINVSSLRIIDSQQSLTIQSFVLSNLALLNKSSLLTFFIMLCKNLSI